MAPKEGLEKVGGVKPAGRGSLTIALRGQDIAGIAAARMSIDALKRVGACSLAGLKSVREAVRGCALTRLAVARAAPLLASVALSGCAPVGPNFERAAAIVSPQFKEIKGWKIATPHANEPKGAWWSVFHDPELDQLMRVVAVSNQTIKADEANYRQALALINQARAGLYPTINGVGSATRSSPQ